MRIFSESWNDEQQVGGGEALDGKGNTPHSYRSQWLTFPDCNFKRKKNLEIPTLPIYQMSSKVVTEKTPF